MKFQNIIIPLFLCYSFSVFSQDMKEYTGGWEGKISASKTFNLYFEIEHLEDKQATLTIYNSHQKKIVSLTSKFDELIKIPISQSIYFEGTLSNDEKEIRGFIKSGLLLYHITLKKTSSINYVGVWNILMIDQLKSQNLYLSIENGSANEYQAYPILGDDRFTGTWCGNFQKEQHTISFTDFKTGLEFKGILKDKEIELHIFIGNNLIDKIILKKSENTWEIGGFTSPRKKYPLQLSQMESLIDNNTLSNTHAVLVSRKGKLMYENYFKGYNSNVLHDMRSASKSISSAIVGIAKDNLLFNDVKQSIFNFLPKKYQKYKDSVKAKIDIQSLLTMSSGLDAIDYGIKSNPKSSAIENNYQPSKDWIASILKASMLYQPNTKANYGSANPFLLGIAMDSLVSEPLEIFMDKKLFQKLGIINYCIQTDMNGVPYFGGGMYLTPTDMLKFGELYLFNGKWNSNQIISKQWVQKSIKNYRNLENVPEQNGYGYLWWHNRYLVDNKELKTIEARGAGGQYIFVVPSLEAVVVITSGNYRNGKTRQPEMVFEKYILPNILK